MILSSVRLLGRSSSKTVLRAGISGGCLGRTFAFLLLVFFFIQLRIAVFSCAGNYNLKGKHELFNQDLGGTYDGKIAELRAGTPLPVTLVKEFMQLNSHSYKDIRK